MQLGPGETYQLSVVRGDEELTLTCEKVMVLKTNKHFFAIDPEATTEQIALRDAWLKNL